MPKISACIVAYCDYEEVCAAVRSILQHTPAPDFALYVVDNGSPDGCGQRLAETDFGDARVTVLPLAQNLGFGKGHNAVIPRLDSAVHFILNPDILLTGDVLEPMADWLLAQKGAAMASPCPAASRALGCCWRSSWPRGLAAALPRPMTTTRCRTRT